MYIRTKDGVYGLVDTYYMCVDGVEIYMYDNNGRGVEIRGSQILNQSENLDELCDEFVMVDNSNNKPYRPFIIYGRSLEELNERQSCNESIYGAIWTDKGLIYVAKMNEKGELELI